MNRVHLRPSSKADLSLACRLSKKARYPAAVNLGGYSQLLIEEINKS